MSKLRLTVPALLAALLMSFPALQHGLVDDTLPFDAMLIRVGVALALAMVGRAVLASVVDNYRLQNIVRRNRRERAVTDGADGDGQPSG
jgi:hypothetical protein